MKRSYAFPECVRRHVSLESEGSKWKGKMTKMAVYLENYHGQRHPGVKTRHSREGVAVFSTALASPILRSQVHNLLR